MARFIDIETTLEPDKLLFYTMRAKEELSRLSEYEMELLSLDPTIDLDDVLGTPVTVKLELDEGKVREFSGYVTRIALAGTHGRYALYRAMVRPWLWFLTRTTNCRIFQQKSVPDILKEIFALHAGVADVKFELTETYTPWEYCVQYRESDFDFVSRLMEHEGIYYFFKHEDGRHTLVVADSYSAHSTANGGEIPFIEPQSLGWMLREHISEWAVTHELQPGKYALTDYDFEKPSVSLEVRTAVKRKHALAEYEVYEYPGDYIERGDGEQYVRTRIEEIQAKYARVEGRTNARAMSTGYLFTLTSHPREDQNTEYLVLSAHYTVKSKEYEAADETGADYHCQFTALNSQQPFRSERITPKPVVQGPQTALTVGPSGEEIHTDKFGRVKVQFHWDRNGTKDDKSSCWIRVSQNWGGKGWGGMFIPHVGQEVIVQFLEGDPDMPLITGRVYNAENMPPVALPGGKTQSIIRDHGANEILMEGDGGKQRITMFSPHADTKFSMGAPNSPSPGFFFMTSAHWEEYVKANKAVKIDGSSRVHVEGTVDTSVHGDNNYFLKGNYVCRVMGWQEYSTFGHYLTKVLGFNTVIIIGADTDIYLSAQQVLNVGSLVSIFKNFRWENSNGDIWRTPLKKYMAAKEKIQIGEAMEKIGKERKKVARELRVDAQMMREEADNIGSKAKGKYEVEAAKLEVKAKKIENKATKMINKGVKIFEDGEMKVNNVFKVS